MDGRERDNEDILSHKNNVSFQSQYIMQHCSAVTFHKFPLECLKNNDLLAGEGRISPKPVVLDDDDGSAEHVGYTHFLHHRYGPVGKSYSQFHGRHTLALDTPVSIFTM